MVQRCSRYQRPTQQHVQRAVQYYMFKYRSSIVLPVGHHTRATKSNHFNKCFWSQLDLSALVSFLKKASVFATFITDLLKSNWFYLSQTESLYF